MARRTEDWDSDCEVQDGETVHVPMLCDGTQYHFAEKRVNVTDAEQRQRRMFRDAYLKTAAPLSGHRPGFCKDILDAQMFEDALACGLAGAIERRQEIFDAESRRRSELWRGGPATMPVADKLPDPDEDNGNGGDDDEEDDDSDSNGESDNGSDDESELQKAMRDKEAAYQEAVQRSQNAWRTMGGADYGAVPVRSLDPNRATAVEAQGERVKAETGKHQ
jgi:hypothetical protein